MDLDDIEIKTVEVLRSPDGTRFCRISYVRKPPALQDPEVKARVQFVEIQEPETRSEPPAQTVQTDRPTQQIQLEQETRKVRRRRVPRANQGPKPEMAPEPAPPPKEIIQNPKAKPKTPRKPWLVSALDRWDNTGPGLKALIIGTLAAVALQVLFMIIRASNN